MRAGALGHWTPRVATYHISSKTTLTTVQDRAIDLSVGRSCVRGVTCVAWAWALGLVSRWGASTSFLLSPPTSDWICKNCIKEIVTFYRVGWLAAWLAGYMAGRLAGWTAS